jgi:hypothetical protein
MFGVAGGWWWELPCFGLVLFINRVNGYTFISIISGNVFQHGSWTHVIQNVFEQYMNKRVPGYMFEYLLFFIRDVIMAAYMLYASVVNQKREETTYVPVKLMLGLLCRIWGK